jgi:hypothetical protein
LSVAVAGTMRADLSWGNVTGETRFDVQRSPDGKTGWLTIAATQPDVTVYSDVSVPTSQPYFYRVVAVGSGGSSAASNVVGTGADVSAYDSADISATPTGRTTVVDVDTAFDVAGGGGDVNGGSDRFRFVYRQLTGDFDVRVRLESLDKASDWTKAGLMARQGLNAGSRNVFVMATPDVHGYRISSRLSDGGATLVTGTVGGPAAYPNAWLRLRRVGPNFGGYRSSDGVHWFIIGSRTVNMPATLYFGMAVTSHNTAATATAKFRDLSNVLASAPVTAPVETLAGVDVGAAVKAGSTRAILNGEDYDLLATPDLGLESPTGRRAYGTSL